MFELLNSVDVHVVDATGAVYCASCSSLAYEQAAIRHARWWMRQRKIGDACRPLRLHVERYLDPTAKTRRTR
jgi:hypothetical protein